ncbi:HD domain-containing protein [Candidatus Saccharibacteria bacterium]|nr:HD domain-containing protein [Candidatus Saccharibacteria bacterium]
MEQNNLERIWSIYEDVMAKERSVAGTEEVYRLSADNLRAEKVYNMTWQILEATKSEFVSRSYNSRYGLCNDEMVFESVAAHTNLATYILDLALDVFYRVHLGLDELVTFDGYKHREMIEAIRVHDLGENEIGDIPDNGDRDNAEKDSLEMEYFERFMAKYPAERDEFKNNVLKLLGEMQTLSSFDGRLIYMSDKISALLVTLCLDSMGKSPMMKDISPHASARDVEEMKICDYSANRARKASEMWAIDFFKMRRLNQYDDTTFFTAIIVMATLMVNGTWYKWREKDYPE